MRAHFASILVLVLALAGCSASPYASLSAGVYACETRPIDNTCGATVASYPFSLTLEPAHELLTVDAPGLRAGLGQPGGGNTLQFGGGVDPERVEGTEARFCPLEPSHTVHSVMTAEITSLGTDALAYTVRYDYTDLGPCAPPALDEETCAVAFETTCALDDR